MFLHFPEIRTSRLHLRRIVPTDLRWIHEGLSDRKVTRFYAVHFDTLGETEEQMEWYEELWQHRTGAWWAICRKPGGQFLGACGFNNYIARKKQAELGYWLLPRFWGQGFATEALTAILHTACQEADLLRIEAYVEKGNRSSSQVLENLGFRLETTLHNSEMKNDRLIDVHRFVRERYKE